MLVREVLEDTGIRISMCQMISEFMLEVLPSRWVQVVAVGCMLTDGNHAHAQR
jgi:hypothetical protein